MSASRPIPLSALRQPALLCGPDGTVLEANDRAETLAGRKLGGRSAAAVVAIFDIRSPAGAPLLAADLPSARVFAGEEAVDVPLVVTAADGRRVHVLASAALLHDGDGVVCALTVWQDVSELERERDMATIAAEEPGAQQEEVRPIAGEHSGLDTQRQLLDIVLGALPHCVSVWDRAWRLVWANERLANECGLARKALVGRSWRELRTVLPVTDLLDETGAAMWAPAGLPVAREVEVAGPGGPKWRAVTVLPIFEDSHLVITEDVTERRRAEDALRESEARYRRLVDDDISGDFIAAPDGRILDSNPAFARMFGFASIEEARSSTMVETYIAPGEREQLLDRLRRERRLENDERFRRRRDGDLIHVVENIVGEFDDAGNLVEIRGYVRDDTQRYRAEEALRASEERLRLAQESANVAVWDWVMETGVVSYTPAFLLTFGVDAEAVRDYDAWRRLVHPEDLERVETERNRAIAREEPFATEYRVITPSGEVRWLSGMGRGIHDAQGRLVRVLGVNLDITERKEAEADRARFLQDLQRSNEELQRFAYVASHDLQEPLRSIISFTQLLERRYRGRLDGDADEFIDYIVEGGTRMQRLIEDLLQLSRVETKARPLVPTDAGRVVADVCRSMETPIRESGATVTVGDLPTVKADAAQLAQVFTNLVSNALKFRRPDVPPVVCISAERAGSFWQFAVRDNGIGIDPEYHDRIFVLFQRLHSRDEYEGTGIGLAVCQKIVERHGGRVRVESAPGEGSTFSFTLPAA